MILQAAFLHKNVTCCFSALKNWFCIFLAKWNLWKADDKILVKLTIGGSLVFLLTLGLAQSSPIGDQAEEENVCSTQECLTVANKIIANMNQSMNPCDDFYQVILFNMDQVNGRNILYVEFTVVPGEYVLRCFLNCYAINFLFFLNKETFLFRNHLMWLLVLHTQSSDFSLLVGNTLPRQSYLMTKIGWWVFQKLAI